jgi:hypothetical protein
MPKQGLGSRLSGGGRAKNPVKTGLLSMVQSNNIAIF